MSRLVDQPMKNGRALRTLGLPDCLRRLQDHAVEDAISQRIEKNATYTFYFREVTCKCASGIVKIGGRVPTDRLRHTLWSLLLGLKN